jgi:hypothetical protein
VVAVVVRPGNTFAKMLLSNKALVEVGRRSYGLYLWHWPIFVVTGARENGVRLAVAMTITVVVNEFSYAFIETPARKGAIGNWWGQRSQLTAMRRRLPIALGVVFISALVGTGLKVAGIEARDLSVDTANDHNHHCKTSASSSHCRRLSGSLTCSQQAKWHRKNIHCLRWLD